MSTTSATAAHWLDLVHIGDDREPQRLLDFGEDRQRPFEADAAASGERRPVRLVEGGLENEADVQPRRDVLQRRGHLEGVGAAFHLAGPGEHRDGQIVPEGDVACRHVGIGLQRIGFLRFVLVHGPL